MDKEGCLHPAHVCPRRPRGFRPSTDVAGKATEPLNIHFGYEAALLWKKLLIRIGCQRIHRHLRNEIGGKIKVKSTMDGDKTTKIKVPSNNETPFFDKTNPILMKSIIAANFTEVEVITGAAKSPETLSAAVIDACLRYRGTASFHYLPVRCEQPISLHF